jgi:ABC-type multidrug transport system fused ATPase/permease subunit
MSAQAKDRADAGLPPKPSKPAQASIMGACLEYTGMNMVWLIFFQAGVRAETICSPLVLKELLSWLIVENPLDPTFTPSDEYWGYIYVVALFLMSTASNFFNNRFFYIGTQNFAQIRSSLNSLIYTKALRVGSLAGEAPVAEKAETSAEPAAAQGEAAADADADADAENNNDASPPAPASTAVAESPKPAAKKPKGKFGSGGQSMGQIVNLMSVDTDKIGMVFYFGVNVFFVPVQIVVLVYLIYDVLGSAIFAGLGVILVLLPMAAVVMFVLAKFMQKKMMYSDQRVKLTNEILQGIRAIKYYAWEYFFRDELEAVRMKEIDQIWGNNLAMMFMTFFFNVIQPLTTVTTFLVYSAMGNELESVAVFQAVAYINALQGPLMQLPSSLNTLISGVISAGRIQAFLQLPDLPRMEGLSVDAPTRALIEQGVKGLPALPPPVDVHLHEVLPRDDNNIIEIEDAAFSWTPVDENGNARVSALAALNAPPRGRGKKAAAAPVAAPKPTKPLKVLDKVNLQVRKGELTAIVGPVGCGKSSLINAILDELSILEGQVRKPNELSIAYVSQSAWIQTLSIRDNILFTTELDSQELLDRYEQTLDACALRPDLETLDMGDLTEIGDRGVNLSGGQKQRVAIARAAFAREADVYIFEDPLSALDAHVAEHIFTQCVSGMLKGKTRVLVTNQLHFLSRCDSVYVMGSVPDTTSTSPLASPAASEADPRPADQLEAQAVVPIASSPSDVPVVVSPTATRTVGTVLEHGPYAELSVSGAVLPQLMAQYYSSLEKGAEDEEHSVSASTAAVSASKATSAAAGAGANGTPSMSAKTGGAVPPLSTTSIHDNRPAGDDDDDESEEQEQEQDQEAATLMLDAEAPEFSVIHSVARPSRMAEPSTRAASPEYEAFLRDKARAEKQQEEALKTRNTFIGGGKLRKGQQVTTEELNTGNVSFGVYLYHLKTMGSAPFVTVLILSAVLCQAAIVGMPLMLSYWSDDKFDQDTDFYMNGYASLLGIMCFFLLVRGWLYAVASVRSSTHYHERLIFNVLRASSVFFDTTPVGRIVTRLSTDIDKVRAYRPLPHETLFFFLFFN